MKRYNPKVEFTTNDFRENIARLRDAAGCGPEDKPLLAALLTRDGEPDFLLSAKKGSLVTCLLIAWLSDMTISCVVDDKKFVSMMSFYAPILNEPGHSAVEFMKRGAFSIKLLVTADDVAQIEGQFDRIDEVKPRPKSPVPSTADRVLRALDLGLIRVAERNDQGVWHTNQFAKKAVLISFQENLMQPIVGVPGQGTWYDKVPSKFAGWGEVEWEKAGFRAVPNCVVRHSAYVAPGAVLMPSFVNLGAYVGENTMIDTWATVGACAQVGKDCHISGGAGIGGVLEPPQDGPVIIEDDCFIGARSEVVEGVIVREGAVLSMGVFIGKNTPIVDRTKDGQITFGEVPARAVVMSGLHPANNLVCPQIVKYRDERTDAATALNDALRG